MARNKKEDKASVSITVAVVPAIIVALAGIVGAYFSYLSGVNVVRIPLNATQTAEANQISNTGANISSSAIDIPIAIDAQKSWQLTGLEVKAGEMVSVQVVGGKWSTRRDPSTGEFFFEENSGTSTYSYICGTSEYAINFDDCPIKQAKLGSLVGRIGSTKYEIGNNCVFQAVDSSILELMINDTIRGDNFGVLAVEVSITDSQIQADSSSCGFRSN